MPCPGDVGYFGDRSRVRELLPRLNGSGCVLADFDRTARMFTQGETTPDKLQLSGLRPTVSLRFSRYSSINISSEARPGGFGGLAPHKHTTVESIAIEWISSYLLPCPTTNAREPLDPDAGARSLGEVTPSEPESEDPSRQARQALGINGQSTLAPMDPFTIQMVIRRRKAFDI